jgi:hypothetical protein
MTMHYVAIVYNPEDDLEDLLTDATWEPSVAKGCRGSTEIAIFSFNWKSSLMEFYDTAIDTLGSEGAAFKIKKFFRDNRSAEDLLLDLLAEEVD